MRTRVSLTLLSLRKNGDYLLSSLSPSLIIFGYMYFPIQGIGKEISKTIAELYRSFSRAASLVPTAEANVCCEELCKMILSVEGDWSSMVRTLL